MAHATCTACGAMTLWSARRGARLADHTCPKCGGTLRGGTGAALATRGRTFGFCVVCQRRRWDAKLVTLVVPARFCWRQPDQITPAGAQVCGRHQVLTAEGHMAVRPDGHEWLYARDLAHPTQEVPTHE